MKYEVINNNPINYKVKYWIGTIECYAHFNPTNPYVRVGAYTFTINKFSRVTSTGSGEFPLMAAAYAAQLLQQYRTKGGFSESYLCDESAKKAKKKSNRKNGLENS